MIYLLAIAVNYPFAKDKWVVHKIVSSHSGKRSFVSNALLDDLPKDAIKALIGNKSDDIIDKSYNRLKLKDYVDKYKDHEFFK